MSEASELVAEAAPALEQVDFRQMFQAVLTPCLVLDPDLVIVEMNEAFLGVAHRTREDLVGRRLFDAFPDNPDTPEADGVRNVRASLQRARDRGRPDAMALQRFDIVTSAGAFETRYWSPLNVPVLDQQGRCVFLLHQVQDVTEYVRERDQGRLHRARGETLQHRMHAAEADLLARARELQALNVDLLAARDELREQALHDPLTGLVTRPVFLAELTRALHRQTRRHPRPLAVLFVDLDRLKHINDTYGHAAGDALICCCAQRMRDSVRPVDVVARIGGDEFVVLVEDVADDAHAAAVAERILTALTEPCALPHGREVRSSASIGIALSHARPGDADTGGATATAAALIAHADAAMYRVKQAGRGHYQLFDQAAYAELQRRQQLEAELRVALTAGQLRLHYQPIIDLRTGVTAAVEALLRWEHPTRGLLPAGDFIGVAEDTGVIVELGDWALNQACREFAAWTAAGCGAPRRVFVNISAHEVTDQLADRVRRAATAAHLPVDRVVLEITETGALNLTEQAASVALEAVDRCGIELALDDFGTGHSSLSRLVHLPFSIIKIDKSFVQRITSDRRATAVVTAVLLLAHDLGKTVIAEGIEDEKTLQTLSDMGCSYGQGYHLARPGPPPTP